MKKLTLGFTLLELLITLTILAILVTIAVPPLNHFLEKQRITAQIHSIWRLLTKTRAMAVSSGERVSICGVDKNQQCSREGIQRFIIYKDINRNNTFDGNDVDIEHLQLSPNSKIQLTLGGKGKTFAYNSDGFARQPGGVIVCPNHEDLTLIQKVTFNKAGRLYLAPDRNGDGRVENNDGSKVECN